MRQYTVSCAAGQDRLEQHALNARESRRGRVYNVPTAPNSRKWTSEYEISRTLAPDACDPQLLLIVPIEPKGEKPDEPRKTDEVKHYSRWWLQIVIGNFCFRALYDSVAARAVMGPLGLQIASDTKKPFMPCLSSYLSILPVF